jgi:hypothetical protein
MRDNDWADPEWRAVAGEWIRTRLAALGTPLTAEPEEVRVRPWSVSYRLATAAGVRWFKANTGACAYEAGLAQALAGWAPGRTLAPLAIDSRGWLLTADAGPTLREQLDGRPPEKVADAWAEMLRSYAGLQRAVVDRADAMVRLGVPDLRVPTLPGHLEALLADPRVQAGPGVAAVVPAFGEWCAALERDGVPATLQHDDLTDANVFADGRFFDWGDAGVAHPFGSLLVALGFAEHLLGPEPVGRLRDAYLETWTEFAPMERLRESAVLAWRVTRVSRALAWRRAVRDAAMPVEEDFRTAAAYWLGQLPAPPPRSLTVK